MTSPPHEIRNKLHKVLKDRHSVWKSAKMSFQQFDEDHSNTLDFKETQLLIQKLCKNLQLPPVEESTLRSVFARYDDGDGDLDMEEFAKLYYDLLLRIRDEYFPERTLVCRRAYFVGHHSLSEERQITDILKFEKKLGTGSFGQVFLVTEISIKKQRVCKMISKDRAQIPVEQIQAEILFMKNLDHPNIIKIYDVYEDYHSLYLLMEICSGGELMQRITITQSRGMNEKYVATVFRQIMEALCYVHAQKIAHKDLKPENVMFEDASTDSRIKVIDFGVAEMFKSHEVSHKAAGTALYMAPEVWSRCFNIKCDIWSAGCMLYLMLTGRMPFKGTSITELKKSVMSGEPQYDVDCSGISTEARDLLKMMLRKNPHRRPSCVQILKHPWFETAPEQNVKMTSDVLDNLSAYMKKTNLKQVLSNLLTHQLDVNGSQIRKIINMFRTLDKDGDGTLSSKELTEALTASGWSQWDINKVVQCLDVDDSGNVAYSEFLTACYNWQEEEINLIWSAFQKLNPSGDGKIPVEDLADVLCGGEIKFGDHDAVAEMVTEIDKDGNGYIEWDEFLCYLREGRK